MKMWRKRANRDMVIKKGPEYPFMMWVPRDKSPSPHHYHASTRSLPKPPDFTAIPVDENWVVWGFKDLEDQHRFCNDLRTILSGVDDGNLPLR